MESHRPLSTSPPPVPTVPVLIADADQPTAQEPR